MKRYRISMVNFGNSEGQDTSSTRAADADRERVVEMLNKAYGEGRLSIEEFDERMGRAYEAKTYGDLDRLVEDLPGSWRVAAEPVAVAGREVESEKKSRSKGPLGMPSNATLVDMSLGPFASKRRRDR